ncbi:hypothetical protein RAL98_04210 [Staphylococcus sp. HKU1]|uniref:hypothetical protein n=1 Tax=Staphylococcus sp. HKU1 TaxID=3068989 RepID=UPI003AAD9A32
MITEILNAYDDVAIAGMKVSQLRGESDRLTELTGYLIEKAKAYREEGDNKGAEAIELVVLDDIKFEFDSVHVEFQEEMENWKQKYNRFENICVYYGVPVPTLKKTTLLSLEKEQKNE